MVSVWKLGEREKQVKRLVKRWRSTWPLSLERRRTSEFLAVCFQLVRISFKLSLGLPKHLGSTVLSTSRLERVDTVTAALDSTTSLPLVRFVAVYTLCTLLHSLPPSLPHTHTHTYTLIHRPFCSRTCSRIPITRPRTQESNPVSCPPTRDCSSNLTSVYCAPLVTTEEEQRRFDTFFEVIFMPSRRLLIAVPLLSGCFCGVERKGYNYSKNSFSYMSPAPSITNCCTSSRLCSMELLRR